MAGTETRLQTVMIASPTEMNQTIQEKGDFEVSEIVVEKGIKSVTELQTLADVVQKAVFNEKCF